MKRHRTLAARLSLFAFFCCIGVFIGGTTVCWSPTAWAEDPQPADEDPQYKWALTLYGGLYVQDHIRDVYTCQGKFPDDAYLMVLALSRELWRYKNWCAFEAEGQIGKHFGDMHHWEFNGLLDIRWLLFPWDKYVDTSFMVGDGLSYATEIPEVELAEDEDAQRLLNYLVFELALGLPQYPQWDAVIRLHHRSGIFGLFGGVHHGSNFVTGGIKYKF